MEIALGIIISVLLVALLITLNQIKSMIQAIATFQTNINTILTAIETSVAAIAAQGGVATTLSEDDQAVLDSTQARTQAVADSIAKLVTPPTP